MKSKEVLLYDGVTAYVALVEKLTLYAVLQINLLMHLYKAFPQDYSQNFLTIYRHT